jgi:hypothetical protein
MVMRARICTYYTAFCFMDSAQIASGLAYNGYDKEKSNIEW